MNDPKIICAGCEKDIENGKIGLGFNIGKGPVYYCSSCKPPLSEEETVKDIERLMGSAEDNDV